MDCLFISIEGGEGVGKSTFTKCLENILNASGRDVVVTREPGGTPVADRVRNIFTENQTVERFTPESELMLVSAARAQHVHNLIRPSLASGKFVLCDRFADSTRVYQGFLGGVDTHFLELVIEQTSFGYSPDITFLLDCDVNISAERVRSRARQKGESLSRYDAASREVYGKIRRGFLSCADKFRDRFMVLDASKDAATIIKSGVAVLNERFDLGL